MVEGAKLRRPAGGALSAPPAQAFLLGRVPCRGLCPKSFAEPTYIHEPPARLEGAACGLQLALSHPLPRTIPIRCSAGPGIRVRLAMEELAYAAL